jgi:hypothetical protein
VHWQTAPYQPAEGDIIIFTYRNPLYRLCYCLAGSGPPYHAGIVVRMPTGELATLEAGATSKYRVYLLPLPERLPAYEGRMWVRRLKTPLTAEESAALTHWAAAQTDKRFAFCRLALNSTFRRPRGSLGTRLFGETCLDRGRWFCSELVVAACAVARRVDPAAVAANGIYPRDLFLDTAYDFSIAWGAPLLWSARPASGTAETVIESQALEVEEQEVLRAQTE